MKQYSAQPLDAPLTFTVKGRLAATIRFLAFTQEISPEEFMRDALTFVCRDQLNDNLHMMQEGRYPCDVIDDWLRGAPGVKAGSLLGKMEEKA